MLWKAGLIPGLIVGGFLAFTLSIRFREFVPDSPGCAFYDPYSEVSSFRPPDSCYDVDVALVAAWSLGAFVAVVLIGLAAEALWPGWNDAEN